jgi:hypothetical protein
VLVAAAVLLIQVVRLAVPVGVVTEQVAKDRMDLMVPQILEVVVEELAAETVYIPIPAMHLHSVVMADLEW